MELTDITFPIRRADGGYLGMTTLQEQDWCRAYAQHVHTGKGALVELGCFFGSLTLSLAEGLQASRLPREAAVVQAYDLFYWHRSMVGCIWRTPLEGRIKEGDWFIDVFKANTAHLLPWINVHWADLGKEGWEDGPIELLLLDCLKYDAITNNVIRNFFPSLRPGLSRMVHQDYFHFYEWWTHLLTWEQRDLLEIEEEVPHSGMLVLKVCKDFSDYCARYPVDRDFSKTPVELLEAAYEWNYSVISPANHDALTAARIWAHVGIGRKDLARRILDENRERYASSSHFSDLLTYCEEEGFAF